MIPKSFALRSLADFVTEIEASTIEDSLSLFRGQSVQRSLLPSIARQNPARDTTQIEEAMLAELRRTGGTFLEGRKFDDWELLVKAQHFGMKTRLLDWTTNPLAALWFACSGDSEADAFVYWMKVEADEVRGRSGEYPS